LIFESGKMEEEARVGRVVIRCGESAGKKRIRGGNFPEFGTGKVSNELWKKQKGTFAVGGRWEACLKTTVRDRRLNRGEKGLGKGGRAEGETSWEKRFGGLKSEVFRWGSEGG